MAFAQGASSGLSYIPEVTFGTTPSTPSMLQLPFNTHSLNLSKDSLESGEIREDRQIVVHRHGNRQAGGDITVELRASDFDDLLESAFFSSIDSSGVMKAGTTPKFLSIEDRATDIAQYRLFTGMAVSSMSVSIQSNAMVTATFSLVGKDMTISGTSVDASPTAASSNQPFDGFQGTIQEGGSPIAIITGLDFTLDNSMNPTFVLGSQTTPFLEYGRSRLTGTVTAYFENATLLNKFINETPSTIQIGLDDGVSGNAYTFLLPEIKYNGGDVPVQNEQSRVLTLPFIGLKDTSEATNIKLTKS